METIMAVGIDLAVQHLDTGVCVLRRPEGGECLADFDRRHRADPGLADLIARAAAADATVAIDVPLGWPEPFRKFLQDPTWPGSLKALEDRTGEYRFQSLRLRQADIALWEHLGPTGVGRAPDRAWQDSPARDSTSQTAHREGDHDSNRGEDNDPEDKAWYHLGELQGSYGSFRCIGMMGWCRTSTFRRARSIGVSVEHSAGSGS